MCACADASACASINDLIRNGECRLQTNGKTMKNETQHVVQHFDLSVSVVLIRSFALLLACQIRLNVTATSQIHNTKSLLS